VTTPVVRSHGWLLSACSQNCSGTDNTWIMISSENNNKNNDRNRFTHSRSLQSQQHGARLAGCRFLHHGCSLLFSTRKQIATNFYLLLLLAS
jgi:hypothetical protein